MLVDSGRQPSNAARAQAARRLCLQDLPRLRKIDRRAVMQSADFWRTALRRLFAVYLLLSGIALGFPHRPRAWPVLLLLHVIGIVLLLGIGPASNTLAWIAARFPRTARWFGDWYTLLIMPLLY